VRQPREGADATARSGGRMRLQVRVMFTSTTHPVNLVGAEPAQARRAGDGEQRSTPLTAWDGD
jgi:hypothetical protein